jgi:hypothetical protein
VKPHSVFLRNGCSLPERLDPLTSSVGEKWALVEEITAAVFDTMIRRMDWHFTWVGRACSRMGLGTTEEGAINRALARALAGVTRRFNAAELVSVQTNRSLGLHIAIVTVQPRLIQQHSWLDFAGDAHPQTVPAR